MLRKKKKVKTKRRGRKYLFLVVFLLSFFYTCFQISIEMTQDEYVRYLFLKEEGQNPWIYHLSKVGKTLFPHGFSLSIKNPFSFFIGHYSYQDYSKNDSDKTEKDVVSSYVEDPYPEKKPTEPKVYLYNTHQLEEYSSQNAALYNVTPNVMMLSYILREKLDDRGIPTIVEENNVSEFLNANNWNYASSYKVTRFLLEDAKANHPSLTYFIDLHRDSVKKSITTTTIDGVSYARTLFILGMENPNYQENAKMIERLQTLLDSSYPGLSRGIYKKQGKGVNGVYNQDFDPHTILIEVGGVENSIEEVFHTAEAIANVLERYIEESL